MDAGYGMVFGDFNDDNKTTKKISSIRTCVVLEMENGKDFETKLNRYLYEGYKIEASSCNSRYYKAILVLDEE